MHTLRSIAPAAPFAGPVPAPESAALPARRLRIALLGYRSHPHCGGQGIYLRYLSRALIDLGHRVDVISGPPYPALDSRVRLIRLPSLDLYAVKSPLRALRLRHLASYTDLHEWLSKLSGGFAEPYTFGRRLVRYLSRYAAEYDVIHDNQSLCHGLLALAGRGLPVVATVHHPITRDRDFALAAAPDALHGLLVRRWYGFLRMQQRVARRIEHLVTVSERARADLAADFDIPAERIRTVPNGIDTELFRPLPGIARRPNRLIATASADAPLKGMRYLLAAYAHLRARHPDLELEIIGQPRANGPTARLLAELGLRAHVRFRPGVSDNALVRSYAEATLAVVPSLYEGFGLPAAEAMACAVPVIATTGGALPEVVGDAGVLVPPGDAAALERAIDALLRDPERRAALGQAGRTRVRARFAWPAVARQMTAYYLEVLARHGNG